MSLLLAAIGVFVSRGSAVTPQVPRFGGLYQFEAARYTYPDGQTWGPYKEFVFMPLTDKG